MSNIEMDNESTESGSLLIEVLEIQVQELINEKQALQNKVNELEARLTVLQNISDSEIINNVFSFL